MPPRAGVTQTTGTLAHVAIDLSAAEPAAILQSEKNHRQGIMDAADKNRKKAWQQQQRQLARNAFPMADALLQAMFEAVEARVDHEGCDHSLRFTQAWLADQRQAAPAVIAWLNEHGGFCDCEVVANAADHWEQNR